MSEPLHFTKCICLISSYSLADCIGRVSFHSARPIRPEMLEAVKEALETDLMYELPINFRRGAGDTYFSGKMLAKLARVIIIADEVTTPVVVDCFIKR